MMSWQARPGPTISLIVRRPILRSLRPALSAGSTQGVQCARENGHDISASGAGA